ncbi:25S rRNA (adenine645-N1)-methyltransferase [Myotisia sp. PD_48]|nr:25S rRNA (adenine645-N1)-methyltransferase [Myotisia sp. PD_48]
MFAVPGWSVPASELKPQKQPTSAPGEATGANGETIPKKRKRGRDTDGKVTKANVDDMWKKYIETDSPKTKKDRLEKSVKSKNVQKINSNKPPVDAEGEAAKPKKRRRAEKQPSATENHDDAVVVPSTIPPPPPTPAPASNLTPLQQSMRQKLLSARFRHLNETLYTTPSSQAMELFTSSPEMFADYHAGFSRQVKESWPSNPVDGYISAVKKRGSERPSHRSGGKKANKEGEVGPLPRRRQGLCTIVDLGCGDAQFARSLAPLAKKSKLKLLNYDLHSSDSLVTKADISALPLEDGVADVAIFCLSLMGTNWVSFVEEAWRVLRGDGKGECWVSEVKSRFGKVVRKGKQPGKNDSNLSKRQQKKKPKNQDGDDEELEDEVFAEDQRANADDDETDISAFIEVFSSRGFILKPASVDKSNKMFVKMEFVKHGAPKRGKWATAGAAPVQRNGIKKRFIEAEKPGLTPEEERRVLKPCVYKTR